MNINVIAEKLQQDRRAQLARGDTRFPEHATFMKGGAHALETVFFEGASLREAKSLARVLNALPLALGWQAGEPVFAPAQVHPVQDLVEAGNCFLELMEDGTRFLHFWLDGQHGLLLAIVQLQGAEGPRLSVLDSTQVDASGRIVSLRLGSLTDDTGEACFALSQFEAAYGREATGFAFWAMRH